MRRDSRLSDVLHILLHMAEHEGPVTSEALARAVDTNPVVVRRVMSGLRDRGYVGSEKGDGGGWSPACDLGKVSLRDIYEALGRPPLFALGHREDASGCLVGRAVREALDDAFRETEALLPGRLGKVTLARLSTALQTQRSASGGRHHRLQTVHAA